MFTDNPFSEDQPQFTVVKAHSESFANIHNNIFALKQLYFRIGTWDREGCFGIAGVAPSFFGSDTVHYFEGKERSFHMLAASGFFGEDWKDKYKDSIWAPMWDLITFDKVAKMQNYKKELFAKGEPEEIVHAKAVLLGDALGWNHKLPDGTVYEGDYWDCIKTKFKKYYDEAVAECEGKGELELLNRLHTLTLEMYWFKRLVPTITTRAYDNICVGLNPCYIIDGKVDLGYYRAESEVIMPDDMKAFSDDKYNLSDEAIAYIKEKMPTFVPFSIENAGTGKRK